MELSLSLFTPSLSYLNTSRMLILAKDETGVTEANLLIAQIPTFIFGQLWRQQSNLKSLLKPLALQEASPSEAHRVVSIH